MKHSDCEEPAMMLPSDSPHSASHAAFVRNRWEHREAGKPNSADDAYAIQTQQPTPEHVLRSDVSRQETQVPIEVESKYSPVVGRHPKIAIIWETRSYLLPGAIPLYHPTAQKKTAARTRYANRSFKMF